MDLEVPTIIKLTENHEILHFDCGDKDLNEFLYDDAKPHYSNLLSVTYLLEKDGKTAAFFSVLNDKLCIEDLDSKNQWKKIFQGRLNQRKRFKSYPAVKIGRFAVHQEFQRAHLGGSLLDYIKGWFISNNKTGCMYLTVDAYKDSLRFYEKNQFNYLSNRDAAADTRLMYYDLTQLK